MDWNGETPRAWTAEEDDVLMALWPEHGRAWPGWDASLPGRTRGAIASRAQSLGLRRRAKPWTREQLLRLFGYLRGAAAVCDHEPADCAKMLNTVARMWETECGTRRGSHATLSEHELAELLADWRGGASAPTLARKHGVSERTISRWIDEACTIEALRSVA